MMDVLQAMLIILVFMAIRFAFPLAILFAVGAWANRRHAY